jgi:hypothetical protein
MNFLGRMKCHSWTTRILSFAAFSDILKEEAIMEDIQTLSVDMAQSRVREEAAVRVENMNIDNAKEQSDQLAKLMESAQAVTDPTLAQNIDLLA